MSIQSLVAAAHAAGYAMAAADDPLEEALEVMPRQFVEEFGEEPQVEVGYAPRERNALVVWQDPYYRASWVRDWIASWRFGRATA